MDEKSIDYGLTNYRLRDLIINLRENSHFFDYLAVFLELVFIIVMIGLYQAFFVSLKIEPKIQVSNMFSEVEDIPEGSVGSIGRRLFRTVLLNSNDYTSIENSGVVIREGSLINHYFDTMDMHYLNFIVDIPSLRQSYQVFHEWTDADYNPYLMMNSSTMVMCLPESKVIYDDFKCQDEVGDAGRYVIVDSFKDASNLSFYDASFDDINNIHIDIMAYSCESYNATLKKYDDWFKSLGFSLSEFDYKARVLCESRQYENR